jgi:hypothetical protein
MAATAARPGASGVEDFVRQHADTDPKELLELILQENERMRNEYRVTSEVEIDDNLNFKPKTLAQLQRLARMYAESGMVPDHYKGNIANCAIGVQMALRCKVDILTFLQSSYIVHGKPGIESKLAIAMLNASGKIKGRLRYKLEGEGKARRCTAQATDAGTGDLLEQTVDMAMAEAESWTKNPKWRTMPDLMLQYRSAMFLCRLSFPDVLMGMRTLEELEDVEDHDAFDPTKAAADRPRTLDDLTNRMVNGNGNGKHHDGAEGPAEPTTAPAETHDRPSSSDTDGQVTAEADESKLLSKAATEFSGCERLTQVGKLEEKWRLAAKFDATRASVSNLANAARDRLRKAGGAVGAQKQGELATT